MLDYKTEKVEIVAGRLKGKLVAVEGAEISVSVFYEGLRRTGFAVIDNHSRFTITGILLITHFDI